MIKAIQLTENNIGEYLCDFEMRKNFLSKSPRA